MIYKVIYQPSSTEPPLRENSRSLYMEADSVRDVRQILEDHTSYLVEYIQELEGAHLEYEQKSPDFKLTEFDDE